MKLSQAVKQFLKGVIGVNDHKDDFIMLPKVDFAFKELMMNEKVRAGFLSAVLDIKVDDIKSTQMKNTNLTKEHQDEKQGILDVRLIMNDDTEINIEMQVLSMATWTDRSVFYVSKMLSEQVGIDKKYTNIMKCIGISIVDFNCIRQTENYHTVYHIREDSNPTIIFSDKMEWHMVELPKLPSVNDGTNIYNWTKFFKTKEREEFEMLAQNDEYLQEAYRQLDIISQDEQKRMEYDSRTKMLYHINTIKEEGIREGRQEGIQESITAVIAGMKAAGYSEEQIQEIIKAMPK